MGTAFNFFLYSNLFISACALVYIGGCLSIMGPFEGQEFYLQGIFFATLAVYTIHRWIGFTGRALLGSNIRNQEISRISKQYPFILLGSLAAAFYFFLSFPYLQTLELCIPLMATGLYIFPFHKGKRLRDFPFVKNVVVACVWAYLAVIFPSMVRNFLFLEEWIFFISQFSLIFCLILPLDYRDREKDLFISTKTLANSFSLHRLKILGYNLLLISLLCYLYLYSLQWLNGLQFVLLLLCLLLCIPVTYHFHRYKKDWQFSVFTDGILMLQGLLMVSSGLFGSE